MTALGANQGTHAGADTPLDEIVIAEALIGSTLEVQLLGVFSRCAAAGSLSKEGKIDTVGIDPAGGAYIGLGSCWINRAREFFDMEEGKALLKKWGIPETYRGVGNCILGYAEETPEPKARVEGRIYKV